MGGMSWADRTQRAQMRGQEWEQGPISSTLGGSGLRRAVQTATERLSLAGGRFSFPYLPEWSVGLTSSQGG